MKLVNKKSLFFMFVAGTAMVVRAVQAQTNTMPSNSELFDLMVSAAEDDLDREHLDILHRLALANNNDPEAMATSAYSNLANKLAKISSDPLTEQEQKQRYDEHMRYVRAATYYNASAIPPIAQTWGYPSGASVYWSVEPDTYKTPEFLNWRNDFEYAVGLKENLLFVLDGLRFICTEFVNLASNLTDQAKLAVMRKSVATYGNDFEERSDSGNFTGTRWENSVKEFNSFLMEKAAITPPGVTLNVTVREEPKQSYAFKL